MNQYPKPSRRRALRIAIRLGILLATLAGPAAAQLTLHHVFGGGADEGVGASVASVGDVNGDGFPDLVATAPAAGAATPILGSYYLLSGFDGSVLLHKISVNLGEEFGTSVAALGDVDGDGKGDYIVTAPGNDIPVTDCGRIRVYTGANASVWFALIGSSTGNRLGSGLAALGDVDGDGIPDLAVGSPFRLTRGEVAIHSGNNGAQLATIQAPSNAKRIGFQVANVGDLTGDGIDDVACGDVEVKVSSVKVGVAYLFSGLTGQLFAQVNGATLDGEFGRAITGLGDVDGDGIADFAVGAPRDDVGTGLVDNGSVRVVSGFDRATLYSLSGRAPGDLFGSSLARMGDLDGDGIAEIVVGAPNGNQDGSGVGTGEVAVYSGATGVKLAIVADGAIGCRFGTAVSSAGDVDGDGLDDLLVGAPADSLVAPGAALNGGAARVYLGQSFALVSGGGQANGPGARFEVNGRDTAAVPGPFSASLWRGEHFTFDLEGAPHALYEIYGSWTLNPAGWNFPGFGTFDLGTGPAFADVYVAIPGFTSILPLYQLDGSGRAILDYYLPAAWPVGPFGHLQALVQNQQPWVGGVWGSLSAAQSLVIR